MRHGATLPSVVPLFSLNIFNIFIANKFPVMYTMSVKDIYIYIFELVLKDELHVDVVSCHGHPLLC